MNAGSNVASIGSDARHKRGAFGGPVVLVGILDLPPPIGEPTICVAPEICSDDGSMKSEVATSNSDSPIAVVSIKVSSKIFAADMPTAFYLRSPAVQPLTTIPVLRLTV